MGALGLGVGIAPGRQPAAVRTDGFDFIVDPPPGVTVARASPATCIAADGTLATRGPDTARIDHDRATGAVRGLLVEPVATNLVAWSADLSSGWVRDIGGTGTMPTVTTGDAAAPDGTMSAARISFVRGDGFARIAAPATDTVPGSPYTLSIWLKAAVAGPSVALRLDSVDSGTLILTQDWRRYSITADAESAAASAQILLWSQLSDAPATATIHAWGVQLEAGVRATSLIQTAGTAQTRAADQATLDWGSIGIDDGPVVVRYLFDDGSSQTVEALVVDGVAAVPGDLARTRIRSAARA